MTMTTPADDDADDDLIAYLDGELEGDASREVEEALSKDETVRSKAEAFQKTYDLLDYLPKPEPSPTFTTRTITKLEPSPVGASLNGAATMSYAAPAVAAPAAWQPIALWGLAALAAAVLGYFGHLLAKPHLDSKPAAPTLQQVRLLERLPLYVGVDDLNYLKNLDESQLFSDSEPEAAAKAETVTSTELAKLEELFKKLPENRQQQLRQLDEDFFALDLSLQAKLGGTLERYAVWLDRMPENYRKEILEAPAAAERLEAVRRVRERLWREHLPAAVKAKLAETADKEEAAQIRAEYRRQEAERRHIWDKARQQWLTIKSNIKPFPFDNSALAKEVEDHVNATLKPRLNPFEAGRLEELRRETQQNTQDGSWWFYGAWIHYFSEAHPSLPEPKNGKMLLYASELPPDFLRRIRQPGSKPSPVKREFKDLPQHGKWPDFALLVEREATERNVPLPFSFGPSKPGEFKPEVESALKQVQGKLNPREAQDLDNLKGRWPQYPQRFLDLARKYDISVPGVMLPGSPHQWARLYPGRRK